METKLARHLERKHREKDLVKDYLEKTEPKSKERSQAIAHIRKRSHYAHNEEVKNKGEGVFLVERRSAKEGKYTMADYWPCPECLGFYHRKSLAAHVKSCGSRMVSPKDIKIFYQSFIMKECSDDKFTSVLAVMNNDEVAHVVKSDATILQFGRELYESYEHTKEYHVSCKMREVGKMMYQLRKKHPAVTVYEVITGRMFDAVVEATKVTCGIKPGQKLKSIPSLALKIGHTMKKLAVLITNAGIKRHDDETRRNGKMYLHLHNTEWSRSISKYALDALVEKKKAKVLPLTSDLQVLCSKSEWFISQSFEECLLYTD